MCAAGSSAPSNVMLTFRGGVETSVLSFPGGLGLEGRGDWFKAAARSLLSVRVRGTGDKLEGVSHTGSEAMGNSSTDSHGAESHIVVRLPDKLLELAPDIGGVYALTIRGSQWRSDQQSGRRKLKREGRGWSAMGGAGERSQPVSSGRLARGTDGIWGE